MNLSTHTSTMVAAARAIEGKARKRVLHKHDVEHFRKVCRAVGPGKRVRVYSSDGFVSNSYGYPTEITYIERTKEGNVYVSRVGASRAWGRGALTTVNGKPYTKN